MNTEEYLLKKVDELDKKVSDVQHQVMELRTNDLLAIHIAITSLKVRSSLWGAAAGVLTILGAILLRVI